MNNIIGLTDEPNEMFGKMMSVPDSLLNDYLDLVTDFHRETRNKWLARIKRGENPMELKKAIAFNIITQYHNEEEAVKARDFFEQQFQNKSFDGKNFIQVSVSDLNIGKSPVVLLDLCKSLKEEESSSQIKRLIEGGGVTVNNEKITDSYSEIKLEVPMKIKLGKRQYFELV